MSLKNVVVFRFLDLTCFDCLPKNILVLNASCVRYNTYVASGSLVAVCSHAAYKRQHKGHAESYNALYSMASMVRFNKGTPLDEEQREKMTRLVAEAAQGLREEYGA